MGEADGDRWQAAARRPAVFGKNPPSFSTTSSPTEAAANARSSAPSRRNTRPARPCDQRPHWPRRGARVAAVAGRAARVAAAAPRGVAASAGPAWPPRHGARGGLPVWSPSPDGARRAACARGLDSRDAGGGGTATRRRPPRPTRQWVGNDRSVAPPRAVSPAVESRWVLPMGIWLVHGRDGGSVTAPSHRQSGSPRARRGNTAGGGRQRAPCPGSARAVGADTPQQTPFPLRTCRVFRTSLLRPTPLPLLPPQRRLTRTPERRQRRRATAATARGGRATQATQTVAPPPPPARHRPLSPSPATGRGGHHDGGVVALLRGGGAPPRHWCPR